jgi:hypothetical protein
MLNNVEVTMVAVYKWKKAFLLNRSQYERITFQMKPDSAHPCFCGLRNKFFYKLCLFLVVLLFYNHLSPLML